MAIDPSANAYAPSLDDAIDRQPLIVAPDTPLTTTIALISQAHSRTCGLDTGIEDVPQVRSSCAIVMADGAPDNEAGKSAILGILTERDVVRLAAENVDVQTLRVADVMVHPVVTLPQSALQDIFAALFLFRRYRIRHLPVLDVQGQLLGVISHESIRQILRPANLLRFRRVVDVMIRNVIHAPLETPVLKLAQLMAAQRVSCVVITQLNDAGNDAPVGIVTERDIVQFQALQVNLATTQAATVMSTPLFLLSPEDSLWLVHQEMQQRRVGRLVVSWNWGQGLGLVTQTSLLKVFDPMEMYGVIANLQATIQLLLTGTTAPLVDGPLPNALRPDTPLSDGPLPKAPLKAVSSAPSTSLDLAQVAYSRVVQSWPPTPTIDQVMQLIDQILQSDSFSGEQIQQLQAAIALLHQVKSTR